MIEESELDHDQLECFELREIEKIEIEVFNWFEKTMMLFCIFNNISFLFIQSLLNITSWWSISAISIDIINFLWFSMMRLSRILWMMIFLNIFSSYSLINFSFVSDINWISSFLHTLLTKLACMSIWATESLFIREWRLKDWFWELRETLIRNNFSK